MTSSSDGAPDARRLFTPTQELPQEMLAETQARFVRRGELRALALERLNVGGPLAAETPQRALARLTRLGVPLPDAQAVVDGGQDVMAVASRLPEEVRLGLERVIGANDLVDVAYLDLARAASRAVGRVVVRSGSGRVLGYGTGWLCGPGVMLTNHHVLEDAASARSSVIEFDYERRPDKTLRGPVTRALDPAALFVSSEALDYALVAVSGDLAAFGWLPLFGSADKNLIGEALSIIQHPAGEPKQVALRENRLVDRLPDFLHYETDTSPGSSGSPVFNDAWEVVALHHSGVPRTDDQGRTLRRDGTPAQPGDADTLIDWIANEGVRISRIVDDLRSRPELADHRLVQGVLAAQRPPLAGSPERTTQGGVGGAGSAPLLDLGQWSPAADGTLTLPVTLKLRVAAAQTPPPTGQRPYLEPQDEAQAARYYADLPGQRTPQQRFLDLSELVIRTHIRVLSYDPAGEVYPWVDLWPDGQLRSLYSGRPHAPEAWITADRSTALRRQEVAGREGLVADALEEALPYNCEHVVPQSWFGKRQPMRGDLHHLFACEPDCNSFRGNTPYFDFPDYGEAVRTDCGRREPGEFEPAQGKGAAARATLYFLLRYPGVVRQYSERHLQTLLAWHAAFPPGDWEQHRNAAIFARQGNRNPLIDHPAWAAGIAFAEGLGR